MWRYLSEESKVIRTRFVIPNEQLDALCRHYHVRELSLYGSVLREDYRDDSDVDLLVEFEPDAQISLFELSGLQQDLADILGRKADLIERRALHPANRLAVLEQARSIWPEWQATDIVRARPFRREWLQLHVMIDEAEDLAEMLDGQDRASVINNDVRRSALIVPLARIGWLAGRLPEGFRCAYADVDWSGWAERGTRLTTRYWDIDWHEVWSMAAVEAPELRKRVAVILAAEFPESAMSQHNES